MTPERWQEIENLYHAVQERGPAAMDDAEPELRREVESLLAKDSVAELPPVRPGAKLGPYEILERIGAGGMGEVWKARDTRLGRSVAIKTARVRFEDRFAREARAVAALNHPHICTLHDVGPDYLVMELVEGVPLKGPMSLDRALPLAIELAEALDAAHRKGIVHRDLKPGNIMVTKGGIKVLDFGLATMDGRSGLPGDEDAATKTALTKQGEIVGTLQYMSPEQLNGKQADARSDIFAFGCVLYEMLTGNPAFAGKSAANVIAAVAERPAPSVSEIAPALLDRALQRCLAKDPDERWQSARDLQICLEWIAAGGEILPETKAGPSRLWQAGTGLFAAAAILLAILHFREVPPEALLLQSAILAPPKAIFDPDGDQLALSPDGRLLVFRAVSEDKRARLYLRALGSSSAQPLEGTTDAVSPAWSPDSKSIAFRSQQQLRRLDVAGGSPITLADISQGGPVAWSPNGTILFLAGSSQLRTISSSGGAVTDIATGGQLITSVCLLSDGTRFLYSVAGEGGQELRAGSLDRADNSRLGQKRPGTGGFNLRYSRGHLLMKRGEDLIAARFDEKHLTFTGQVVQLPSLAALRSFTVAGETLVYGRASAPLSLAWFDRTGHRQGNVGNAGDLFHHLSHDRRHVVVTATLGGNRDLWVIDLERNVRTRLTTNPGPEFDAAWSPDDRRIIFSSARNGHTFDIYTKLADGTGGEQLLYASQFRKFPISWSPDGKTLLFGTLSLNAAQDIYSLPLSGDRTPVPFVATEFSERQPQFSPDGKWVAWQSDESGRYEVYVAPFPVAPGRRQVSVGGGTHPRWRPDGKELFYVDLTRTLIAAEIALTPTGAHVGTGKALFGPMDEAGEGWPYDVSADGQRILALSPVGLSVPAEPLMLVQNWTAGLKK